MAGVITTGAHPKALWPGIRAWWGRAYDEHTEECVHLFDMEGSERSYEEDVQVTGFGLAPVKPEGQSTSYDSENQGYVSRYTHVAYSLGYIVTHEELADNLYEEVSKRRSHSLAFSGRQTKEIVAANIYNKAFDATQTGGDGSAMIVNDHSTLSGNQSNLLTTAADLSETAIEDLLIQIWGATNERGLQISLMGKCLVVPRQLFFNAQRILGSTLQNDTANNAINVLNSGGFFPEGVKMNHYLTDPDAWFIRTNAPRGLVGYQRESADFTKDNDFDTSNAKAKFYERYSFRWTDWRGIYGTPGA